MPTQVVEDYLKVIYKLSRGNRTASTTSIADCLGIAAGSVTGMLKRLSGQGLVDHVPYYGARLTKAGEKAAIRMIRRHRVLELFLVEILGYTWDRVHDEAERLEHAASDELIDRMAEVLGTPQEDPHGAPIPAPGKELHEPRYASLADLPLRTPAVIRRVSDDDPRVLRHLAALGLLPGTEILVSQRNPFDGPLQVRVGEIEHSVGHTIASLVKVEALDKTPDTAHGQPDSADPE